MLDYNPDTVVSSPCLILAHSNPDYQSILARAFRRLGWDVYTAHSGPEARRLARMLDADVVVLHTELPEESGWLTCDKLMREQPLARVVLLSDNPSRRNRALADFVGASALLHPAEGMAPLIEELLGSAVHAAG